MFECNRADVRPIGALNFSVGRRTNLSKSYDSSLDGTHSLRQLLSGTQISQASSWPLADDVLFSLRLTFVVIRPFPRGVCSPGKSSLSRPIDFGKRQKKEKQKKVCVPCKWKKKDFCRKARLLIFSPCVPFGLRFVSRFFSLPLVLVRNFSVHFALPRIRPSLG